MRRQDYPVSYELNGAIYISDTEKYLATRSFFSKDTIAFVMPRENSIDIDNLIDLKLAELFLQDY